MYDIYPSLQSHPPRVCSFVLDLLLRLLPAQLGPSFLSDGMAINCGGWDKRWVNHQIGDSDRRSQKSFVQRQLSSAPDRPPLTSQNWTKEIVWFNLIVVTVTPIVSIYGLITTTFCGRTFAFCVAYYLYNMIGVLLLYRIFPMSDIVEQELLLVCEIYHKSNLTHSSIRLPQTLVS